LTASDRTLGRELPVRAVGACLRLVNDEVSPRSVRGRVLRAHRAGQLGTWFPASGRCGKGSSESLDHTYLELW